MILPDHEIARYCEIYGMVEDYDPDLINPASLDVRLGPTIMVEVESRRELETLDIGCHTQADPYWLAPGEFVLGQTRELFNIPDDIAAQFVLKSSRAREGIEHLLAGFADPGFHGSVLTLELQNARRLHSVPLWPNMKIGQLVFYRLESRPTRSYAEVGHYNNNRRVMPSRVKA
jgi:dCTP deaminase